MVEFPLLQTDNKQSNIVSSFHIDSKFSKMIIKWFISIHMAIFNLNGSYDLSKFLMSKQLSAQEHQAVGLYLWSKWQEGHKAFETYINELLIRTHCCVLEDKICAMKQLGMNNGKGSKNLM